MPKMFKLHGTAEIRQRQEEIEKETKGTFGVRRHFDSCLLHKTAWLNFFEYANHYIQFGLSVIAKC